MIVVVDTSAVISVTTNESHKTKLIEATQQVTLLCASVNRYGDRERILCNV